MLPIAQQWQGRPLQRLYALVYMDAIHFNVKQDNQIVKKVYVAIGVKIDKFWDFGSGIMKALNIG